jgi:hypothetical protein
MRPLYRLARLPWAIVTRTRAWILYSSEPLLIALLRPVNAVLCRVLQGRAMPHSVLHISYMVHVPYYTVLLLRRHGMRADYLAMGTSPHWHQCDYNFRASSVPLYRLWQEFWMFWRLVARYEVVHAHFMITLTQSGWELPLLRRMGRPLVVHFRGCEARDRARNMALHPAVNICQECDYHPHICHTESAKVRRERARRYGDAVLVTTPDMLDFMPEALYFPFFAPPEEVLPTDAPAETEATHEFTIVHVTHQPGIEGTRAIEATIERLRAKGRRLRFEWIHGRTHTEALAAFQRADLAIGKMKMGYYANAQIESLALGVPTITFVRDEFMTDELRRSGFIFSSLERLEATIEHYLDHPDELAAKRRVARESILHIHDNDRLSQRLGALYEGLVSRARSQRSGEDRNVGVGTD